MTPLLKRPFAQHVQAVAPDGSIVFLERQPVTGSDLWTLAPDGRTTPLVVTPFNEDSASISADGRFVAYVSDESGRKEVYAIPASGQGDRVAVSIDGGSGPVWSRDGRELFYRAGDDLISVQVQTDERPGAGRTDEAAGPVRVRLRLPPRVRRLGRWPALPGDSHRPESRPTRLDVILNWFDELERKVAGAN